MSSTAIIKKEPKLIASGVCTESNPTPQGKGTWMHMDTINLE